ncbi:response regulator [Flavihumibacter sp. CACIAM 22H1]|uniref:response regulator transcription factor n=1 Tax=Flavihumibacter sp. CACIAM 22H1 TaxID=1812911 RepID=UPI0007A7DD48|nr:response regulator [Flavihumibacter sp. CACIAM 22H1]KYP15260.1 MAG: two-component system response regulator [Flavihumibacter sp. CACIAM 22H1]
MTKATILLVDDNEDILQYLRHFLQKHFAISTAHTGKEALEKLQELEVQLIVSDVMMPEMDGFELCRTIKSSVDFSHIPVILLTAKNTLQDKLEGLELGADVYIEKPFSPEYLYLQINSLLVNRTKVLAFYANNPLAHIKSMANDKADEQFLEHLNNLVQERIENPEFDVDHLAKLINVSRPTLYRKLKEITNLTPNEIIHLVRLKRAATLLLEGQLSIHQISEKVGYTSPSQFSRNFQKQFGVLPSEYAKDH